MKDGAVWEAFVRCERRWLAVLLRTRALHENPLGKRMTPVRWLPERGRGTCGWLGYYWEAPPFWFGFGPQKRAWLPLIECDVTRCDPKFIQQLESHLPAGWRDVDKKAGRYWRLWAPSKLEGDDGGQVEWFAARSRELHEFTPGP